MLDLIPTLFAQQQVKQAAVPVSPIEPTSLTQAKPTTPAVTPPSAIATPESAPVSIPVTPAPVSIPVTPAPVSISAAPVIVKTTPIEPAAVESKTTRQPLTASPQPVGSAIVLPKPSHAVTPTNPKSKPTDSKEISATPTKLTEKSTSNAPASVPSQPRTPTVATDSNSATSTPAPQTAIEIPVPKPNLQTASPAAQSPTQHQKQRLEQRLADIVAKDRAEKQAQQRDTLVARAYSLATQRRFEQARKLLQNPSISTDVRAQILSNINSLESASRAIGVTQIKEPTPKPIRVTITKKPATKIATKPPAMFTGVTRTPRSTQKVVTIQVPQAIQSISIQRKALVNDPTVSIASDSAGSYIDQLVPSKNVVAPKNLQAYNRNLPKLNSRDQFVYPLPEPVPVTSGFGWRRHPVTGARRFHAGVDLGAGQGTPVIASRGGKVVSADRLGGYGLAIVMQQPDGSQDTLYAHLSQIFVRPGEKIKPGTVIGRVGSTGLSTGPHLHYEARKMTNSGWTAVDPGTQIEAARVRLVQAQQINARSSGANSGS